MEKSNNDCNDGAVPPSEEWGVEPVHDREDTRNLGPLSYTGTESDAVRELVPLHSRLIYRSLGDRVRVAKLQMAQQGAMPGGDGPGIMGYDYDTKLRRRVINPAEAPVVRRIFEEYDRNLSCYGIAKGLNADGIPTKRGGRRGAAVVQNILRNRSYVGIDYYGKTRTVWHSKRGPLKEDVPPNEWIEIRGFTPPLVDLELFERVQRKMDLKSVGCRRVGSHR